jgi:hypothetical protein
LEKNIAPFDFSLNKALFTAGNISPLREAGDLESHTKAAL